MKRALLAVLVVACSKKPPPSTGSPELDAFEAERGPFNGVYISASGLFVNRKLAVEPAQLTTPGAVRAALAATPTKHDLIVFDIADKPASVASAILHDLAKQKVTIATRAERGREKTGVSASCELEPIVVMNEEDVVFLGVEVLPDKTFVAISRIDEHTATPHVPNGNARDPDWRTIEKLVAKEKPTAFFADREDIEIAVDPSLSSGVVLRLALTVCTAGFTKIALVPSAQLKSRILLPEPFDFGTMTTAKEVRTKMREIAGTRDGVQPHVGSEKLCPMVHSIAPSPGVDAKTNVIVLVQKGGRIRFISKPSTHNRQITNSDQGELVAALQGLRFDDVFAAAPPAHVELAAEDGVDAKPFLTVLHTLCIAGFNNLVFAEISELSVDPKTSPKTGKPD